jgi:MFS family permease
MVSALQCIIDSPTSLFLLRPLLGMTEAGFFPGVFYFLSRWYPEGQMPFNFVLVLTSTAISGVIGGPIAGGLMSLFEGVAGLPGWKWMFICEGFPCAIFGVFVYFLLPDDPRTATFLSERERQWLVGHLHAEMTQRAQRGVSGTVGALKSFLVWRLSAIWFLWATAYYAVIYWTPLITRQATGGAASTSTIALLTAVPFFTAAVSMTLVSWHSDRVRERRWHILVVAVTGAVGMAAAALMHSLLPLSMQRVEFMLAALCIAASGPSFSHRPLSLVLKPPFVRCVEYLWAVLGRAKRNPGGRRSGGWGRYHHCGGQCRRSCGSVRSRPDQDMDRDIRCGVWAAVVVGAWRGCAGHDTACAHGTARCSKGTQPG